MNYIDILNKTAKQFSSIICLGLDPVIEDIPINGKPKEQIIEFYTALLNKIIQTGIYPSAVKPNYAFYAQYGIDGIEALITVINIYKEAGLPIILDFKRGDIGKTARAYAKEAFDFFNADAVTLSPYLGYDSISPFIENYPDKGYYILTKTSNKSSAEIQDISVNDEPLYLYMAKRLLKWYHPGIGSVAGATYPEELSSIINIFNSSKKDIPLLIPGVGSQGGDMNAILNILKESPNYLIHRINSSSAINYAYKKYDDLKFDDAAVKALKELNESVNSILDF
ncbi:orotidine-5'-phosphate decarboxylase [Spirochaetota bacterium]